MKVGTTIGQESPWYSVELSEENLLRKGALRTDYSNQNMGHGIGDSTSKLSNRARNRILTKTRYKRNSKAIKLFDSDEIWFEDLMKSKKKKKSLINIEQ